MVSRTRAISLARAPISASSSFGSQLAFNPLGYSLPTATTSSSYSNVLPAHAHRLLARHPHRFPARTRSTATPLPSTFVRGTNNRLARRFARRLNPRRAGGAPRSAGVPGTNSKYDFVSTTVTRRFPRKSRAICDPANPPPRITVRLALARRLRCARGRRRRRRDERERERQAARGHGRRGAGRGRFGAIDDDGDAVAEPARGASARASVDLARARGRGRRASRPTRETTERDARRATSERRTRSNARGARERRAHASRARDGRREMARACGGNG